MDIAVRSSGCSTVTSERQMTMSEDLVKAMEAVVQLQPSWQVTKFDAGILNFYKNTREGAYWGHIRFQSDTTDSGQPFATAVFEAEFYPGGRVKWAAGIRAYQVESRRGEQTARLFYLSFGDCTDEFQYLRRFLDSHPLIKDLQATFQRRRQDEEREDAQKDQLVRRIKRAFWGS